MGEEKINEAKLNRVRKWGNGSNLKCPSNYEYIKKMYIYNGILLSRKKEESFATCNRIVNLERSTLSKINQTEKDRYCTKHTYMWNLKNVTD